MNETQRSILVFNSIRAKSISIPLLCQDLITIVIGYLEYMPIDAYIIQYGNSTGDGNRNLATKKVFLIESKQQLEFHFQNETAILKQTHALKKIQRIKNLYVNVVCIRTENKPDYLTRTGFILSEQDLVPSSTTVFDKLHNISRRNMTNRKYIVDFSKCRSSNHDWSTNFKKAIALLPDVKPNSLSPQDKHKYRVHYYYDDFENVCQKDLNCQCDYCGNICCNGITCKKISLLYQEGPYAC